MGLARLLTLLFVAFVAVTGAFVATSGRSEAPTDPRAAAAADLRGAPAARAAFGGAVQTADASPVVEQTSSALQSVPSQDRGVPAQPPIAAERPNAASQPPAALVRHQPNAASIQSFAALQHEIETYLEESEGTVGVALYAFGSHLVLGHEADRPLPLASLGKVQIMLTFLDLKQRQIAALTPDERIMLESMITVSDNDAADELWYRMGGGAAMRSYLASVGLADEIVDPAALWGDDRGDTPREQAILFARLWAGQLLGGDDTETALDLLARIAPSQKWGITAGLDWQTQERPEVFLKNGWYPGIEGWRVNSAGLIKLSDRVQPYVIVILADSQPSYEYGLETVETVAKLINSFMRASTSSQPTSSSR